MKRDVPATRIEFTDRAQVLWFPMVLSPPFEQAVLDTPYVD